MDLHSYKEAKPNRKKRIVWFFVNSLVFPLLSNRNRSRILRLFGARVGKLCRIYRSVRFYAPWNLVFGENVCIGPRVNIYNKDQVAIGNQVVISQDVFLCTASHDLSSPVMSLLTKPIRIGSESWIAAKATILPNVEVGEGAVVGACAVVAKDVPPWSVVVGNPARVVGHRELKGA